MNENFTEAAERHWKDANLLADWHCIDNADQLYGLTAECALKSALCYVNGFESGGHRSHVNVLWNKVQKTRFLGSLPGVARVISGHNPFEDWDIDQRYGGTGEIPRDVMEKHKRYAKRLLYAVGITRG